MKLWYRCWRRLLTWVGDIYFATEPPKVRGEHIRALMDRVRAGDVLCRKYTYYLDSYLIPGSYSHSGISVGNGFGIHAVAEGVSRIDLIDFVKDSDGFVLLRPRYAGDDKRITAVESASRNIGKPYDFLFDRRDKSAYYCHELTAAALADGDIVVKSGGAITADDIIAACEIVYQAP
ncbi:MAG: YiiX/YebB-like N1pC/P60 family cysteine hydrolase [Patescibacteria group bacterium]